MKTQYLMSVLVLLGSSAWFQQVVAEGKLESKDGSLVREKSYEIFNDTKDSIQVKVTVFKSDKKSKNKSSTESDSVTIDAGKTGKVDFSKKADNADVDILLNTIEVGNLGVLYRAKEDEHSREFTVFVDAKGKTIVRLDSKKEFKKEEKKEKSDEKQEKKEEKKDKSDDKKDKSDDKKDKSSDDKKDK